MSQTQSRKSPLSPEEKRALAARLLRQKAGAALPAPGVATALVEAQAARTPGAVAVVGADSTLTYGVLEARANQLARHLRALGVGPDDRVAVALDRAPGLLVALLGIWKAGAAYLPLDPDYPAERLAFMLDDARPAVLVTERALRDRCAGHRGPVVLLDDDAGAIDGHATHPPRVATRPENLAYILYTSGSTGRPKGVMIAHEALSNFLLSMRRKLEFDADDALLAVTTLSFDIAALELYLPLISGGRVVLAPRAVAADGRALARRLDDPALGINKLQATPATWRMLLDAGWKGKAGLTLLCGGEALTRDLADRLLDCGESLWNLYGPTETTIWSSLARVSADEGAVPIGKPIARTQLYVLDAHLRPTPVGVAGELYIGGAGLARGYFGRPGLTAERFVPDPFGPTPGGRLYRTGDSARWRPDGQLECLGRLDHQVKIRGFRVELGEIEAALLRHEAVGAAAVAARPDASGENQLVAYVVPRAPAAIEAGAWRPWLRERLPDYMVPSAFVVLDRLPLTPNGKIDRNALPAPEGRRVGLERGYVAPRNRVEEVVAALWEEVLGVDRVGVEDDFFALGGHSLLATQVASRLRDAFGVELPVRALFDAPTVAALAGRIEEARQASSDPDAGPIAPAPRDGAPLPLSFAQRSLWFLDQLSPGQATFNMPGALRVGGPLDLDALGRALAEILRRHETLRTTFASVEGRPIQVVHPLGETALEVIDLQALPAPERETEARRLALKEARRPFDLADGPLARVRVARLAPDDHVFLLTMHHIISDGWSFGVAARELTALYDAFRRGAPSPLPPLPIQYADFARWQHGRLQGPTLDRLLGYWKRQLAGVSPLELPTDRPRPPVRTARGSYLTFALTAGLTAQLADLARREGVTPFMLLLAAFQTLLHRQSGQDDVVVGSPVANRNRAEVEGLIGYFVNMLALRTDLSGDPPFRALLGRVREVALGAFEHQELPLETLIEALRPPRDPSRSPVFQVMFVLQNNRPLDAGAAASTGLTLAPLPLDEGTDTAKFDLTLFMGDSEDGALSGGFEFNTDLFDTATIARLQDQFLRLLGAIAAHPEERLSRLPILSEEERAERLGRRNRGPILEPIAVAGIHALVEARAAEAPEAEALVNGADRLTYGALNSQANRLAHHLRSLGVGPDALVGLALADPATMVMAMLGVLKAGGAYVPLDPSLPRARRATMVEEAGVAFLVTRGEPGNDLGVAAVVDLDADHAAIESHPAENPAPVTRPENLAYVLFTSGSTGRPKGVMVAHRSLVNAYQGWEGEYRLRATVRRHLQVAGPSFDVFTGDWVRALGSGGTLIACPRDVLLDPAQLSALIRRERIDAAEFVPAVVELLMADAERAGRRLDSLRLLVVGSDLWHSGAHERLRRLVGPETRVLNSYGVTEATIDSTFFEGTLADRPLDRPAPIGRPLANVRVHVLDRHLEPVPIGVPGELYLGGSGLARGYVSRPRLTAERFLPCPFGDEPGARLYRTGDRAAWRADGTLELLGRVDQQVKIRGFRIELGEIEAALRRLPVVREAAVATLDDASAGKRLVAYVAPTTPGAIEAGELRRGLQALLPESMVPSAFVVLDALPRLASGKVDRALLPAPDLRALVSGAEYLAPRNPLEETLARAWAEVLGVERVGVLDDFFELGGHSLQTVQLVARLMAVLDRPVSVKMVFQAPTVAALAEALTRPTEEPTALTARRSGAVAVPDHVTIERRPMMPLFASGALAPVDSVALSYLPTALLQATGLSASMIVEGLCGNRPQVTGVVETPVGRIGAVMIPRFDAQLYQDRDDLLATLEAAVEVAGQLGARTVSLTGLLPSATDYGRALAARLTRADGPKVTTGQATTTATLVFAIRRALAEGGRSLGDEHLAFIGLGSVGIAALRLMLACLPHPAMLTLCDMYQTQDELRALRAELVEELGYRGTVRLFEARRELPGTIYDASAIVGATSVPDVLDIERVAPGTILIEDVGHVPQDNEGDGSASHLFRADGALKRFRERGDILVTEGGVLAAPAVLPLTVHVPEGLEPWMEAELIAAIAQGDPRAITGCVLSGLLSARYDHLPPTLGLIDRATALSHFEMLDALGFEAARLHLGDTALDDRAIALFKGRYGRECGTNRQDAREEKREGVDNH